MILLSESSKRPPMSRPCFDADLKKPDHVLLRELDGQAVLLNLETETYFGLDEVGARMWTELVANASVDGAFRSLQHEFEVDPGVLRSDLESLVAQLLDAGLLKRAAG